MPSDATRHNMRGGFDGVRAARRRGRSGPPLALRSGGGPDLGALEQHGGVGARILQLPLQAPPRDALPPLRAPPAPGVALDRSGELRVEEEGVGFLDDDAPTSVWEAASTREDAVNLGSLERIELHDDVVRLQHAIGKGIRAVSGRGAGQRLARGGW